MGARKKPTLKAKRLMKKMAAALPDLLPKPKRDRIHTRPSPNLGSELHEPYIRDGLSIDENLQSIFFHPILSRKTAFKKLTLAGTTT